MKSLKKILIIVTLFLPNVTCAVFANDPIAIIIFTNYEYKDKKTGEICVAQFEIGEIPVTEQNKIEFAGYPKKGMTMPYNQRNAGIFENVIYYTDNYTLMEGNIYGLVPKYQNDVHGAVTDRKKFGRQLSPSKPNE